MTEVKFYRKKHIITDTDDKVIFEGKSRGLPSINAAKRESRRLQAIHGQGSLRRKA